MRRVFFIVLVFLLLFPDASASSPAPAGGQSFGALPQFVARNGALPAKGRVLIRSGLAWMNEDSPLFAYLERALAKDLADRGLAVVKVDPSRLEPLPPGTADVRNAPVPELPGGGRGGRGARVMSVSEAAARMQAMHLFREGKLPQARFGNHADVLGDLAEGSAKGAAKTPQAARKRAVPAGNEFFVGLTGPETIRFALSQEAGHPALRGQVDVPGRLPRELQETDPEKADYALVVKFAMLWPGARQRAQSAIVAGWHLLLLSCYDLAPAGEGKEPRRIWNAAAQRVVSDPNLSFTLPDMAKAALAK